MSPEPTGPAPILFTHYGDEWIRGSERCLLDLLTYIDRKRFAPVLWCNARTLAAAAQALEVPVQVSRFTMLLNWNAPRFDFGNYFRLVREGHRMAREHRVRLLHSNSAAPTQWLASVARSEALPLLTHLHAPYNRRERITSRVHQATLAVGVTHGCIEGLLQDGMPEARTTTIYNGVDFSGWQGWDESGLRARLGLDLTKLSLPKSAP